MKITLILFTLLFSASCTINSDKPAKTSDIQEKPFKREFQAIWKNATSYTLEVLDSMPENKLGTRPSDSSMSFRHQIFHIESNLHSLTDRYILNKGEVFHPENDSSAGKDELRNRLKKAFKKVKRSFKKLPQGELRDTTLLFSRTRVPRTRVYLLMRDHMTHHRAQMIMALREVGKPPPDYKGW